MNKKLLVIEHSSSSISIELNCRKLEYNNQSKDEDIHRWLVTNIQSLLEAEKLIIPVRLGIEDAEYMGLYVGLHIRLTKEIGDARFLPILFITEDSKEDILSNQIANHKERSGLLLFTKGCYLISAFLLEEFISKSISPIDQKTLVNAIVPALNIKNSKDPGHQLANEWGAFRLAKFAGYQLKLEKPSSLFFKYNDAFTNNELAPDTNTNIGVFNDSCKALLIDDNADAGWSEILTYILRNKIIMTGKTSSLDIIGTFEDAMKFADYIDYDIIFLDLRLLKEEDKANKIANISDFTGAKVLQKIKDINSGIQVIIFTASNKVWNIERLLEDGANGYYIKESPEFIHDDVFSKENYKELLATINKSLNLKYLRRVEAIHIKCLNYISIDKPRRSRSYQRFYDRTVASFEIGSQLLSKTVVHKKYFNFAFLTYYQIIEDYANQRDNFDFVSKKECYVGPARNRIIDDSTGSLIWKLTFNQDRLNGDYFEIGDEVKSVEVSVQTLAKVSFVLSSMFRKDNAFLKKWAILNDIRNTKAGHGGENGYVTSQNIEELLEIVELLLT